MRVPALLLVITLVGGSAPAYAKPVNDVAAPGAGSAECRQASHHVAEQIGSYRGKRLEPKKLNELPSGTAYMAVYRRINGCEAPLTMVDYRTPRRP